MPAGVRTTALVARAVTPPKPAVPVARPAAAQPARFAAGPPAVRLTAVPPSFRPTSSGESLSTGVRTAIERSFNTDLSATRVHTDSSARAAAAGQAARAFAYGPNIYLGRGERATDLGLLAHESAHVVQQRGGAAVQRWAGGPSDRFESEAHSASAAVLRGAPFEVRERTSPRVQRFPGLDTIRNFLADSANAIPGYRLFTIVIGVNPINGAAVEPSAANILRAMVEFMPGGGLIVKALDGYGIFDKAGAWVEQQLKTLGMLGSSVKQAFSKFISALGPSDAFRPDGVWEDAKRIFTEPIERIKSFAVGVATGIIALIKEAILRPLAKLVEGTAGYDLLKAVLGEDPVTGDKVEQSPDALIGGFMKLIGQEEIWQNMKRSNAVARAWTWFQGALKGLLGFVRAIPPTFVSAFQALKIDDIVDLPGASKKIGAIFGSFFGRFFDWAGGTIWKLLEIIFDVVSPGALTYIKKTGAALKSILKNPLPFVGNLVKAAKLGFQNFAGNFGTHLKAGLIEWLTGSLPGVYIPKAFSLPEIVKFVLSVLGVSWANVRQKLVKAVGEPAVVAMETGFKIVVTLVTQGPAAAWDQIKESLSNLKDTVIGGITDFVIDTVVKKAVPKLIAMFIPGAGFISAILSIYETVMVFVEKISKIIQVVTAFIDSIVAIAGGAIGAAAARVEKILAGLLSLAISFLAGFIGLGRVADKVMGVINKVRAPIDKALDKLVAWIVQSAKKLFAKAFGKDKKDDRTPAQKQADLDKAIGEAQALQDDPKTTDEMVRKGLLGIKKKYKMVSLELVIDSETAAQETIHVEGEINPKKPSKKSTKAKDAIVQIDSFTARPKFRPKTKEAIPIIRGEEDRRHITAWQTMHERLKLALNGKTVQYAADVLGRLKHPVDPLSVAGVKSAGKAYLLDQFNDDKNLWAGNAAENQEKGRRFAVAKQNVDKALATGDRGSFATNIAVLEALWHDPDPTGEKPGFRNLVGMTVRLIRKEFRTRWG